MRSLNRFVLLLVVSSFSVNSFAEEGAKDSIKSDAKQVVDKTKAHVTDKVKQAVKDEKSNKSSNVKERAKNQWNNLTK